MLKPFPEKSRDQMIRDEFASVGAMSTNRFARHCIDAGIWSGEELLAIQIRGVQGEVRKALKKLDTLGLPFAGQTATSDDEDGSPLWNVRQAWLFPDYELNIHEAVSQRDVLHFSASAMAGECYRRFGKSPSIDGRMFGQAAAD